MTHPTLYLAPEVAEILGVSPATLPRKWRRLNRIAGFPRPIPGRPDAWSRALVDQWIDTPDDERGRARAATVSVERQRRDLEAKYGGRLQ